MTLPSPSVGKPEFIVAGHRFNTALAEAGRMRLTHDQRADRTVYYPVGPQTMGQIQLLHPMLARQTIHHADLHADFSSLKETSALSSSLQLGITDYYYHFVNALKSPRGTVVVDGVILEFSTQKEAKGILAHEIAHVELGHPCIENPALENAADKRAVEITRDPLALASFHKKLDAYLHALAEASPVHQAVLEHHLAHYPPLAERVAVLEGFAERIARGAFEVAERGRIKL